MDSTSTDVHTEPIVESVTPITVKISNASSKTSDPPPLINFQLTNPIVYIKAWWKKLIGNEGVKMTIQIKPVTAFILAFIFCGAGFGFGRLTFPEPLLQFLWFIPSPSPTPTPVPTGAPSPTPEPWKDTAFTGKVQFANARYYLATTSAEAITLQVPETINLKPLIGKRILVVGRYNKTTKVMIVTSVPDLEILPASPIPVPTILPSPAPQTKTP